MADATPDIHTIRFIALIDSFYGAAMTFLGKVADPQTGETRKELDKAQAYIDFLETLQAKTEGNLAQPEADHLSRLLTDLRMNYVDEAKGETASGGAAAAESPDAGGSEASGERVETKEGESG